jgi:tRNA(adenine34) deaminase
MESDFYYMGEALAQARLSLAAGEVPVGAEVLALREAARLLGNYRLLAVSLYVTIEPCLMCTGALLQARVRRLVFGAPDPKAGACVSLYRLPEDPRLNHRLEVLGGVREAECRELLQEFFKALR